jgi:hypothetical protein
MRVFEARCTDAFEPGRAEFLPSLGSLDTHLTDRWVSNLVPFFVDFQKGRDLVSLKTTDTRTKSWEAGIRQEIRALSKARINVGGVPGNKFMDIRVQPGGLQEAQRLIAYGRRYKIFP